MATLKMTTNDNNHIWLPNVKRVEQMFFFYPKEPVTSLRPVPSNCPRPTRSEISEGKGLPDSFFYPWEELSVHLAELKESNPTLHGIIELRIQTYENHSAPLLVTGHPLVLLYVVLDVGDEVRPQNWIVGVGQNYLLENGKTIDRI